MLPYGKTLFLFLMIYIVGIVLRNYMQPIVTDTYLELCFKSFLGITFGVLAYFLIKKIPLATFTMQPHYWLFVMVLILMFGTNNYMQITYEAKQYYPEKIRADLFLYIFIYIISSAAEELIFRGFIQTYINEKVTPNQYKVSKGNLFATVLFFMVHIGFFTIMSPIFAVSSLLNVLAFSLVAGYLYDSTKNILVPIVLHIVINMLHMYIQLQF